jgi:hypothetical protein
MLDGLPEDILVNILSRLDSSSLEDALRSLPCVCSSWRQALSNDKTRFWNLLAKRQGIPRLGRRNPKQAFFRRQREIREASEKKTDRLVQQLVKRLCKSDCVAYIRKKLLVYPQIAHHRVASMENRTLLHYASWYGRTKTVELLLEDYQASLFRVDDSNATPLLIAAWAGQAATVKILLAKLATLPDSNKCLDLKGVPPLTSSCGGKGPKTALCWAQRKDFPRVANLLEKVGATK